MFFVMFLNVALIKKNYYRNITDAFLKETLYEFRTNFNFKEEENVYSDAYTLCTGSDEK